MVWLLLGLHSDWTNVANNEDIINLVINPPIHIHATGSAKEKIKVHTSIQIALTLETIWNFRNQMVHNDAHFLGSHMLSPHACNDFLVIIFISFIFVLYF